MRTPRAYWRVMRWAVSVRPGRLRGVAHAREVGAAAVRRRGSGSGRGATGLAGGPGAAFAGGAGESFDATDGRTAHSFRALLDDLATITRNRIQPKLDEAKPFEMLTCPTALQQRAFELLGVKLECTQ